MTSSDRAFRICGAAGFVLSVAVAEALARRQGLDGGVLAAIVGAAVATFLAVALVTKARSGHDSLTYYHHEIAILAVTGALAGLLGVPVLAYLDVTALGLGAFLACARIGCLRAGCCHGRPARRGVHYGNRHVEAGFPRCLRGVALVPVQAIEAAAAAAIVVTGSAFVLGEPGLALSYYVASYAVVRFALEELRGDAARGYARGLSEAQWTSLGLIAAELAGELVGLLPASGVGVTAAAAIVPLIVLVAHRRTRRPGPLDPRHVRELRHTAQVLAASQPPAGPIPVWETSAGVRVSSAEVGAVRHFTLSRAPDPLGQAEAEALALVVAAAATAQPIDMVAAPEAIFHLLVPATLR